MRYKYTSLKYLESNIPEMKKLGVSIKARSAGQFVSQFRKAKGNPNKLSEKWQHKRDGFVARHMASYKVDKGYRRRLALIAWAYNPD